MMLPNGWKKVKLGDVIKSLDAGVSVNSVDEPASKNSIGVLKTSCVSSGSFNPKENKAVVSADIDRVSVSVKADRIILSRMNSPSLVGANAYIASDFSNLYLPDRLWQLEPYPNKVNMRWLSYVLGRQETKNRFLNMATGTSNSMKNITKEDVLNLNISLPPIEEQKKIAATLSVWDSAIEKMEKLIEAKIVQKNSLTCKLIEKSSEAKFKLENVTIDKSKWERKRLGELLEFKNGVNVEKDKIGHGTKMISVLDILSDKPITYDNIRSSVALTTEELSIYSVHYGDVLFQRSSENYEDVGTSNVYIDEKCATFSGFVIRGKKIGAYNPFCLNAILRAPSARCQIMRKAAGAQHVNIGQESLANIQIFLPTLLEQKVIADVLSAIDDELTLLKQQLENYKKQKQGLMQKLLTGEWRVK